MTCDVTPGFRADAVPSDSNGTSLAINDYDRGSSSKDDDVLGDCR